MSIKLTLLKSGETLISETKELVSEEDQTAPHAYLVTHPHIVKITEKVFMTEEQKTKGALLPHPTPAPIARLCLSFLEVGGG